MSVRNLAALVTGLGLAFGMAACTADAEPVPPATSASATAPATTSAPAPAEATADAPATKPATAPADGPAAAKPACPADEAELFALVQDQIGTGPSKSTLEKVVCYKNFAVATLSERADSDEGYVTFEHTGGKWTTYSGGTADICQGVPADVIKHFQAARYGACY